MGIQVTVAAVCVDKQRLGYQAISLSHFLDTSEPSILAGSKVEVGGALYEFTVDETGTGWAGLATSSTIYLYLVPNGASIAWLYSLTAPTWDTAKQGWYNGGNRCFARLYKDATGTGYVGKTMIIGPDSLGDGTDYRLGRLQHLPLNNVTVRQPFSAAPPASSTWSAAIQAAGLYGVPAGAKAIMVTVKVTAVAAAAGPTQIEFSFSDNNSNVPTGQTAHPCMRGSFKASAVSDYGIQTIQCVIPLNALGNFYIYTITIVNLILANCLVSVSINGFFMGE